MTVRRFLNTHYTLPGPDSNGWYRANEFIITAKDGYKISLENLDDSDWTNSLAYTDDTASGSVAFYVRDIQTNEISVSKTENYKLDKTAPEGEIRIKENSFKTFLNTISFGLFFKDTVDVSIKGTDKTSGVAKIEYQKVVQESGYDLNGAWTSDDGFSVPANEKFIVYAKITDNAGNCIIINSNGVVVYTNSSAVTMEISHVKFSGDKSADVTLNGNTINDITNGAYTLSVGTDYTISGGTITFKAAYLDSLDTGNYTLTISYNPLGFAYAAGESPDTTSIALTVAGASQTTNAAFASTDDDGIIWPWFILIAISVLGIAGITLARKRKLFGGK